ncbi:MAG: GNAT family N-acetyltransferase [Bacteroidota bacterium]
MNYSIETVDKSAYENVLAVWEASVRATHDFLSEADIQYFKPLILDTYLDAVSLRCVRNRQQHIIGFSGTAAGNLEMLFIHPDYRGQKVGKTLLDYAIKEMSVTQVDVNEQNEQAVGFYQHNGFEVVGRSELDGTGKPYPILHMLLKDR